MKIGILSDTHGYIDDQILSHLSDCEHIIHAGDFGSEEVINQLKQLAPLTGVYGNIDDFKIRTEFPEYKTIEIEGLKIFIQHIVGRPSAYSAKVKSRIQKECPQVVICGHSHIALVENVKSLGHLHINPGASGHHGFHVFRTLIKASIENGKITDLKLIELGKRGQP